jgi:hypothetical protein
MSNICVIMEESFACSCFADIAPFNNVSSARLVTYRMQQEPPTLMVPIARWLNSANGCHITAELLVGGSYNINAIIAIIIIIIIILILIIPRVRPT